MDSTGRYAPRKRQHWPGACDEERQYWENHLATRLPVSKEREEALVGTEVLDVRNFAQIKQAKIELADLTVLVGPQGAGKSLLLQMWKLALDRGEVVDRLKSSGYTLETPGELLEAYFGEGMKAAWSEKKTFVSINGAPFDLKRASRAGDVQGRVFFVPAHRALLMTEGWPAPFMRLKADTPAVARLFSQSLYERFTGSEAGDLFPVERRLKASLRKLIDDAVFHKGRVELEKAGLQTRLALGYGKARLPFMTWTAGQREFTPLLLGLYRVLPPRKLRKDPKIEWVIIEEPEMGLHPEALNAVMALVLDLLWRGYRVVLSTHSPFVLDVVFAMQRLAPSPRGPFRLQEAFGVPRSARDFTHIAKAALTKQTRTYCLTFDSAYQVTARDISSLDPGSEDSYVADWGGLTGFSSRFDAAVSATVAEGQT